MSCYNLTGPYIRAIGPPVVHYLGMLAQLSSAYVFMCTLEVQF